MNNRLNIFLSIVFIALVIYSLVTFFAFGSNYQIINITLILLAINIVINMAISLMFNKKKNRLLNNTGLNNISLKQIKGLEKVKTIIFSKKGLISKGKYKLINVEHRSTISKKTVIEIAAQLARFWESPYAKSLNKKLKESFEEKTYTVIKNIKPGISVSDETGNIFQLGNYSFVQEYVQSADDTTLYLLKNNILIGKFTFLEKLNKKAIKLAQALNSYGNLVYIDSEFENNNSTLPFDKAYVNMNHQEQKNIISKLSNKAKTTLITTDEKLTGIANFDFLISDLKSNQQNKNYINFSFNELLRIVDTFSLSKKVHNQMIYALSIFLIICILILTVILITNPIF